MDLVIFTDENGVIAEDQRLAALANTYADDLAERARRAVLNGHRAMQAVERAREANEALYASYASATGVSRR